MLLSFYSIVSSTACMYSNGFHGIHMDLFMESMLTCSMESMWTNPCGLIHGFHMDLSMDSMVDMHKFHMEFSGIHVE